MTPAQMAVADKLRDELSQAGAGMINGEYRHPFAVVTAHIPMAFHPRGYVTFVAMIRPDGSRL